SGTRPPAGADVMDQELQQRRVQDGGGVELLARNRGADDGEDARADHRANAERGEAPGSERLLQPVLRLLGIGNQLVNGFGAPKLGHGKVLTRLALLLRLR